MKVLFAFKSENFVVPVGLCLISAIARKKGHQCYLGELNSVDVLEVVAKLKPDVIAYSSSTGEAKHYLHLNQKIKERFPEIFTIMGGPHTTFYPQMIKQSSLDAICVGEGEGAFADILDAVETNSGVENISNIVTPKKSGFTLRNLVEDLDTLPFPDYALLYNNTGMGKYPLKSFITSRGCPYNCTYCFNPHWRRLYKDKGTYVRRHSVDYVIEDIQKVREQWPLSTVKFYDDVFAYRVDDWLEEFAKKYRKLIGLPFFILTRADLLTEDMAKLLKWAGCRTVSMSIEAGNSEIRNKMLRHQMSDEQIIRAHRICDKYGMFTFTNCIVGLPGTTVENDIESVDLSLRCKVDWVEFIIFHPYPGTQLADECVEKRWYKPDYSKIHTSYMHSSPLSCFTAKEKNVQMNLTVLGAVAVVLPFLRNLVVKHLIYWRHNRVFTLFFYFLKMYVIRRKIYVTKASLGESLHIFLRSLKQELFRHESKDLTR